MPDLPNPAYVVALEGAIVLMKQQALIAGGMKVEQARIHAQVAFEPWRAHIKRNLPC